VAHVILPAAVVAHAVLAEVHPLAILRPVRPVPLSNKTIFFIEDRRFGSTLRAGGSTHAYRQGASLLPREDLYRGKSPCRSSPRSPSPPVEFSI